MISMNLLLALLLASQALSEADALDLARKIEKSIAEEGGGWVDRAFDVDAMVDRALQGVEASEASKSGFRKGVKKSFSVGKKIAENLKGEASFKFLRVRTVDGRTRALFRLIADGSINFQEFLLEASPGGGARAVDFFTWLNGEWVSESIRRMYVTALASEPGALGKVVGKDNDYAANLPKVQRMQALREPGKPEEALKLFASLPASLKKEKCVLIVRCMAAGDVGGKEAIDALEAFRKVFPGDASISILSLAPCTAAGRFDQALLAVDELEKALGGDAYLHYQRAEIHFAAGAMDQARAAAAKAIAEEKTLTEPYWVMVTISLKEKKFADTSKWLLVIEKDLGIEIGDVAQIDEYKEYAASPECKAWRKARGK